MNPLEFRGKCVEDLCLGVFMELDVSLIIIPTDSCLKQLQVTLQLDKLGSLPEYQDQD